MAIFSAEEFAKHLESECWYGIKYEETWHTEDSVPLIEARDNAVRIAVLNEVTDLAIELMRQASDDTGLDEGSRMAALSGGVFAVAIRETRKKYKEAR